MLWKLSLVCQHIAIIRLLAFRSVIIFLYHALAMLLGQQEGHAAAYKS